MCCKGRSVVFCFSASIPSDRAQSFFFKYPRADKYIFLQGTPGKAALHAFFALNSNTSWKASPGPSLPMVNVQVFVAALLVSSCWGWAGDEGGGYAGLVQPSPDTTA